MGNPKGDIVTVEIGKYSNNVAVTNIVAGTNIKYHQEFSQGELREIKELFETFKNKIGEDIPPEKQSEVEEKLEELEDSLVRAKPNLNTATRIINWLKKHFPGIANTIVSFLINPLMGKFTETMSKNALEEIKKMLNP
jgi:signal recognition particle GTPase